MAQRLTLDIFFFSPPQKNVIREREENRVMWLSEQGGCIYMYIRQTLTFPLKCRQFLHNYFMKVVFSHDSCASLQLIHTLT